MSARHVQALALALTVSLALVATACGGGASSTVVDESAMARIERSTGGSRSSTCPFTAVDVASAPSAGLPGMRLRARIPEGFVGAIGLPWLAHGCGVLITFAETPPLPDPAERAAFTEGMLRGMLDVQSRGGVTCSDTGGGLYRCTGRETTALQVVDSGGVIGIVRVQGELPVEVAEAIVRSATGDAAAPWDPMRAMSVQLDPVEGLPLAPLSSPPVLRFEPATGAVPGDTSPRLHWVFMPYAHHPAHPDGTPWTEDEIGAVVGERATRELGLTSFGEGPPRGEVIRSTEMGQDAEIIAGGATAGGPVTVYGAFLRERIGVYLVYGMMPVAEEATWLPRFQAQVRSYRVVR